MRFPDGQLRLSLVQWLEWHAETLQLRHLQLRVTVFRDHRVPHGARARRVSPCCWRSLAGPRSTTSARGDGWSSSAGVLYWHFVDAVWMFVFTTYYLTPYLGFGR